MHLVRRRSLLAPIAAVALALVLAGCGTTLDMGKAEREIGASIQRQTGMKVASVDCPEDVRARRGGHFSCTAKLSDGRTAPLDVEQVDADGTIRYSVGP